jgi:hypothetical protein
MIPIKTETKKRKKSSPCLPEEFLVSACARATGHPATPPYGTSEAEASTLRVTRIARLLWRRRDAPVQSSLRCVCSFWVKSGGATARDPNWGRPATHNL